LQRLQGDGLAFIHAGGTLLERNLQPGEVLMVDTGCLCALEPGMDYDIKFVGGFKNALLGGEGVFLARPGGPGKVYLPSLAPLSPGRSNHGGRQIELCAGRWAAKGLICLAFAKYSVDMKMLAHEYNILVAHDTGWHSMLSDRFI
jgi:hypothetical protein